MSRTLLDEINKIRAVVDPFFDVPPEPALYEPSPSLGGRREPVPLLDLLRMVLWYLVDAAAESASGNEKNALFLLGRAQGLMQSQGFFLEKPVEPEAAEPSGNVVALRPQHRS